MEKAHRRQSQPDQPRDSGPTSLFSVARAQKVEVSTEIGGSRPTNHVHLDQPPPSAWKRHTGDSLSLTNHEILDQPPPSRWPGPKKWRSAQNLEVHAPPTTCTWTNLPFLQGRAPTGGDSRSAFLPVFDVSERLIRTFIAQTLKGRDRTHRFRLAVARRTITLGPHLHRLDIPLQTPIDRSHRALTHVTNSSRIGRET